MTPDPTPTDGRPTVLVLRALGLGDLCTAVPALRGLRRAHPHHRVVLAAPGWQLPLAASVGVDEVIDVGPLEPLPETLRHVEVAVNLHGRGPQSTRLLAVLHPGRLVAFHHPEIRRTAGSPRWRADEHEVRRWCRLLGEHGIAADPSDLHLPRPAAPTSLDGAAVVHPGAAAASRRWPPDRYAQVVQALRDSGRQVVLTGSADEVELCEEVARRAGVAPRRAPVVVLAGRTDLRQLVAVIAAASVVISNDTGVAHVATACSTPSVVLFGPTAPSHWGPPASGPHRALWKGRSGDPHGDRVDPGLLAIGVDEVLDATAEVAGASV